MAGSIHRVVEEVTQRSLVQSWPTGVRVEVSFGKILNLKLSPKLCLVASVSVYMCECECKEF